MQLTTAPMLYDLSVYDCGMKVYGYLWLDGQEGRRQGARERAHIYYQAGDRFTAATPLVSNAMTLSVYDKAPFRIFAL